MNRIVSILVLLFISLTIFNVKVNANSFRTYNVYLMMEDDIDVSNVRLNVIELSDCDCNGLTDYTFSGAYTISFSTYWSCFKLELDLSSLPYGFGSTNEFYLIDENSPNSYYFWLRRIDSIDVVDFDSNSNPNALFYSKNNDYLFVDYSINASYSFDESITSLRELNEIKCECEIIVPGNVYALDRTINVENLSDVEKEYKLYQFGLSDRTSILPPPDPFINNVSLCNFDYDNPEIYVYGNRFGILYENDSTSGAYMTSNELISLGQLFTDIEYYFMQIGFNQPSTFQNNLMIYIVYIDGCDIYGEYYRNSGIIYLNKAYWTFLIETASHEYFHSIQNSYQYYSPGEFQETTATYASIQYLMDNNYVISNVLKGKYNYFFNGNKPTKFYDHIYSSPDLIIRDIAKAYSNFIFISYLSYEYCNGSALDLLEDYYYTLSSNQNDYYDAMDFLVSLIDSNLTFDDVFGDFIDCVYPAKLIDSNLVIFDNFGTGSYEEDIIISNYNNNSKNSTFTIPAHGYYVFSIIAPSNTFGKLNLSFSNIGSNINLSALYKTADSVYHNVNFSIGGNGSRNYSLDNFCSYEIIENNSEVMTINIHLSNCSNASQSIYLSYYFDFKVHDNAIYKIKNFETEYLISSSSINGNLYQYSSNTTLMQKWIFKKQNNGSYIICSIDDDDYHFTVNSNNVNSNCYLSDSSTDYYRFIVNNYGYYNTVNLYDNQLYFVASTNLSMGSASGNQVNSSGNVITYYNHQGNLAMWILVNR